MAIVKIGALAPVIPRVQIGIVPNVRPGGRAAVHWIKHALNRLVRHLGRKFAVEKIKLRVNVMAPKTETGRAVEAAIAQDEFHVRVEAAVMPHDGNFFVHVKTAIGHITPATRAHEIDRAAEIAARVIITAGFAKAQRHGIRAVAQHIAIHDHRVVAAAVNRERVREHVTRRVFHGEIFQDKIVGSIQINDRPPQVVGMRDEIFF